MSVSRTLFICDALNWISMAEGDIHITIDHDRGERFVLREGPEHLPQAVVAGYDVVRTFVELDQAGRMIRRYSIPFVLVGVG
jgi:hypothetical protein